MKKVRILWRAVQWGLILAASALFGGILAAMVLFDVMTFPALVMIGVGLVTVGFLFGAGFGMACMLSENEQLQQMLEEQPKQLEHLQISNNSDDFDADNDEEEKEFSKERDNDSVNDAQLPRASLAVSEGEHSVPIPPATFILPPNLVTRRESPPGSPKIGRATSLFPPLSPKPVTPKVSPTNTPSSSPAVGRRFPIPPLPLSNLGFANNHDDSTPLRSGEVIHRSNKTDPNLSVGHSPGLTPLQRSKSTTGLDSGGEEKFTADTNFLEWAKKERAKQEAQKTSQLSTVQQTDGDFRSVQLTPRGKK
jgi:hypothetical protein